MRVWLDDTQGRRSQGLTFRFSGAVRRPLNRLFSRSFFCRSVRILRRRL